MPQTVPNGQILLTPLSEYYPIKKEVTENRSKHNSLVYNIMIWNTAFLNLGEILKGSLISLGLLSKSFSYIYMTLITF